MTRILPSVLLALVFVLGCGGRPPQPPVKQDTAVRPVELPDVSRAAAPVQAQLREQYASLQKQVGDRGAAPAALAAAYGDMGRLVHGHRVPGSGRSLFPQRAGARAERDALALLSRARRADEERAGQGRRAFERALALQPDHVPRLVWLGEMRLVEGRPDAAEPLLRKRWRSSRARPPCSTGLGRAKLEARDYAAAAKNLQAALALGPRRRASTTRWRSPTADWAMQPRRSADAAARRTSTCLRPIR